MYDDEASHKRSLEVLLLIGKLVMMFIRNSLAMKRDQLKPEDFMEYPGFGYFLLLRIIFIPFVYMAIVTMRYFRSRSLREFVARRIKHCLWV